MGLGEAFHKLRLRWDTLNAPRISEVFLIIERAAENERTDIAGFDLGERVRVGEDVQAESYLRLPSLSNLSRSEQMSIICTELHFRRLNPNREPPTLEEYLERFPGLEMEIIRQFDFDKILDLSELRELFEDTIEEISKPKRRNERN